MFLNRIQFNNYVRKYDCNQYVKHFTCWNQLLAMMFGQLCNRESLRDLIVALDAHQGKRYHLGIAKTTLASVNQNRDYRIFEDFAFYMMKEASEKRSTNTLDIPGRKYAFGSTTIPLCLATFPWAKFRKKKGGIKALVLYDIEAQVSAFCTIILLLGHPLYFFIYNSRPFSLFQLYFIIGVDICNERRTMGRGKVFLLDEKALCLP